ncbi:MAG: glycosyltransferase family 2 protein [Zestosphaera sp.]
MCETTYDDLTIIIPTLKEAEGIGLVLDELLSIGIPPDKILVVDGFSDDGTREIAESKGVRVVLQEGFGKADAIKTGSKFVKTTYTLIMDGDYTYPATRVPDLLNKIREGYDLVLGYRKYIEKGAMNPIFRFGNKIITRFVNILYGTRVSDVLTGMYVVRSNILKEIFYEAKNFSIEVEIFSHVANTTGRVSEVPIEYRKRKGIKKLGISHGFKITWDLIRLTWRYNPSYLIFLLGAALLLPGITLGAYVAYHYFFTGINYYLKGLVAILLTLAGFQSLLMAIMSIYTKRIEMRTIHKINEIKVCLDELRETLKKL